MEKDTTLPNRRIWDLGLIVVCIVYQHKFGNQGFEPRWNRIFVFLLFLFPTWLE